MKEPYYKTHEPPHCPTCDCGSPALADTQRAIIEAAEMRGYSLGRNHAGKDAERYRWLRARWGALEEIYEGGTDQMLDIRDAEPGEGWRTDPATLDAAIDAAMNGANA